MAREMMDAFGRVLLARLNLSDVAEAKRSIDKLSDEQKIDLLDELIEQTVNYVPTPPDSDL